MQCVSVCTRWMVSSHIEYHLRVCLSFSCSFVCAQFYFNSYSWKCKTVKKLLIQIADTRSRTRRRALHLYRRHLNNKQSHLLSWSQYTLMHTYIIVLIGQCVLLKQNSCKEKKADSLAHANVNERRRKWKAERNNDRCILIQSSKK